MNTLQERARFNKGLYAWIGFKSIAVPFSVSERHHGASKWKLRRLVSYALDGLTSFSTIPLRVWSLLGLAISLFALFYSAVFMVRTLLFGADIPGFPTLIISVMFFSGAQLISLGILGEYLGRVYDEVKARPLYIVADEVGLSDQAATSNAKTAREVSGLIAPCPQRPNDHPVRRRFCAQRRRQPGDRLCCAGPDACRRRARW